MKTIYLKSISTAIVLVFLLGLLSCGGSVSESTPASESTPMPESTPVSTPAPESTPVSTPASESTPTPAQIPTRETIKMISYENSTYNFSISYPEGWLITEGEKPLVTINDPFNLRFEIDTLYVPPGTTPEDASQQAIQGIKQDDSNFEITDSKGITIDELPGYEVTINRAETSDSHALEVKWVFIINETQAFFISGICLESDYDQKAELINQIIYSFQVIEPYTEPEIREVELQYDDGNSESNFASLYNGYLIDFTPSQTPFTINRVKIFGSIYGTGWEGKDFTVAIWDKDYKLVHLEVYPVTEFSINNPSWVELEMPGVEVTGEFYVHVFTGTARNSGIHIGVDDSVVNEHSNMTIKKRDGTYIIALEWPININSWLDDKSKVNWMIRVTGTIESPT